MIGGEYYMPACKVSGHSLRSELERLFANRAYFATGRDALFALFSELDYTQVWLPNYLCQSVWSPIAQIGKQMELYRINSALLGEDDWLSRIQPNDAALVIHFFGIPDLGLLKKLREKNVTIVSDITHLLFNPEGLDQVVKLSDFNIASLRKSGPFPDGAICASNMHAVPNAEERPRQEFWSLRAAALLSRGYSARHGFLDEENLHMLRLAEGLADSSLAGRHAMSYASGEMMSCFDIASGRAAVAANAEALALHLGPYCELPAYKRGLSQYFVCAFGNGQIRNRVRRHLGEKRIFCPVHWDTSFLSQPHPLSDRLLSIPCDARYNDKDLVDVADKLIGSL